MLKGEDAIVLYSNLLLSAGGGIISAGQQAEQVENTVNILVGLGGTGVECIRSIKNQVYEKLKPDCEEQGVSAYKHIRFLGVDSDIMSFGNVIQKQDAMLLEPRLLPLNKEETFPIVNRHKNFGYGIRQIGRMLMMLKSGEFMQYLENEVKEAKENLYSPKVYIHIFSGLSGAIGSGCFLDVCYMVRKVVPEASIIGYFFLPDVHLSMIRDPRVKISIEKNAYAAMQELDYCMQLRENGGSFQQKYGDDQVIKWELPPVDMCYLIGGTNLENEIRENTYQSAINTVTEYVMAAALTKSEHYPIIFNELASLASRISVVDNEKQIGACMRYCSIGVSCINFPRRKINTYLASELFRKISGIHQNKPTKTEVEKLAISAFGQGARNAGEIYEHLLREIRQGAEPNYKPYVQDWRTVRDYGNEAMVLHYTNQTAEKTGKLETNAKSMMTESNEKSLLSRVRKELLPILKDVNRGPIYAYGMLEAAVSHNLQNIIDGLLEENKARYKEESIQKRYEEYEEARQNFENRRKRKGVTFDSDEKRFEEYKFRLEKLEKHNLILDMYKQLETVLTTVKKQITNVADMYYQRLSRIMTNLIETFHDNCKALEIDSALKNIPDFCMPMMTVKELKPVLDAEIAKVSVSDMMHEFMELFVTNEEDWITEDEVKISKLVTAFFVEKAFSDFTNRTVTSFLRDQGQKVGLVTDVQLAEGICGIMKYAERRAIPQFCFNSHIWHKAMTSGSSYLCIPKGSLPIQLAAGKIHSGGGYISTIKDQIYNICTVCGFPLSSYYDCEKLEKEFFSISIGEAGKHYYEGKANVGIEFTDWNNLPALTPQSLIQKDEIPADFLRLLEKALDLYERARKAGLFNDKGIICAPREIELSKINMLFDEANELALSLKESELDKADEVLQKIRATSFGLYPTEMWIPQDGYCYTEEMRMSIQKDHFVYSLVYQMKVEEILEQISKIENKRKNVEKLLVDAVNRISNLNGITV